MSSGWNGIGIKSVGKTRRKLAEMICQLTGVLVEPEDLKRTNPNVQHWEDCCSWDAWGVRPAEGATKAQQVHIYSWSNMGECVRAGITMETEDHRSTGGISPRDIEISAKG